MADRHDDIEKYLRGEMTPAEQHALERAALDDPFLADALEGGASLNPIEFSADLAQLQDNLQQRVAPPAGRQRTLWGWGLRIAAGLSLLAVSTWIVLELADGSHQEQLALETSKAKGEHAAWTGDTLAGRTPGIATTPSDQQPTDVIKPAEDVNKVNKGAAANQSDKPTAATTTPDLIAVLDADDAERPDTRSAEAPRVAAAEESVAPTTPASSGFLNLKETEEQAERKKLDKSASYANRKALDAPSPAKSELKYKDTFADSTAIARHFIRGQVTSADDGKGLPGVNVVLAGTNTGTVTDGEGFYQIETPLTQPVLNFSFIGLQSKEVAASTPELNVALETDVSQLSEVVVVGYGSEAKEEEEAYPTFEMAVPAGGKRAYKQYLEKNLTYPEYALKNNVEGKVTVQFTVNTNGQLSEFRVIKGLGYGCDEEVIRLVRQGPAWSPSKRGEEPVRDRVKVRVRFALPKKK